MNTLQYTLMLQKLINMKYVFFFIFRRNLATYGKDKKKCFKK